MNGSTINDDAQADCHMAWDAATPSATISSSKAFDFTDFDRFAQEGYDCRPNALSAIEQYAFKKGFAVRISEGNPNSTTSVACLRYGERAPNSRAASFEQKCDCPFRLRLLPPGVSGRVKWKVKAVNLSHNHAPFPEEHRPKPFYLTGGKDPAAKLNSIPDNDSDASYRSPAAAVNTSSRSHKKRRTTGPRSYAEDDDDDTSPPATPSDTTEEFVCLEEASSSRPEVLADCSHSKARPASLTTASSASAAAANLALPQHMPVAAIPNGASSKSPRNLALAIKNTHPKDLASQLNSLVAAGCGTALVQALRMNCFIGLNIADQFIATHDVHTEKISAPLCQSPSDEPRTLTQHNDPDQRSAVELLASSESERLELDFERMCSLGWTPLDARAFRATLYLCSRLADQAISRLTASKR